MEFLQRNSINLGDTIELMKQIVNGSVDGIITDLPYGVTKNKWDTVIPFDLLWEQYNRITKPNSPIILFASQPFTTALISSNMKTFRYTLVYQKVSPSGHFNAKKMPLRAHEDIVVFYKKPPIYYPQITHRHERKVSTAHHKRNSKKSTNYGDHKLTGYDSTDRYPTSVLKFSSDKQKSRISPTQKPFSLVEWLVLSYSKPGDLLLDNTSGSGTLGDACKKNNRDFILIDIDPEMITKSRERIYGR